MVCHPEHSNDRVLVICVGWGRRQRSVVQYHDAGIEYLVATRDLRDLLYPTLEFRFGEGVAIKVALTGITDGETVTELGPYWDAYL